MADPAVPNVSFRRPRSRGPAVFAGVVVCVAAAGWLGTLVPETAAGATDYVEYGAAARLLRGGENPYDASKLLPLQVAAGWEAGKDPRDRRADMMWNPPWVFPLVLPTGGLAWAPGLLAWVAAQAAAVGLACVWVWRVYGGPGRLMWVALAIAPVFAPAFFLLRLGQISGFLLLGLSGFLIALRANRPYLAGAAAALTAIKPHLFLPFAVLLACDAVTSRATRKAVLAGAVVLGLSAAFPLLWNADVWRQYVEATAAPSDDFHWAPSDWAPPTLSGRMRTALDGGLAVQFAASVVCTVGLVGYWWVRRREWDWARELPRVTVLSLLTTGYGAWGFDVVVLLLPIVQLAAALAVSRHERLALWSAMGYLAFNAAVFAGVLPVLWWAPVIAAGYLGVELAARRLAPARASEASGGRQSAA